MAVDSFVQQLIQPMDCVQKLPGRQAASVPAANVVTYGGFPDALQPYFMAGLYTRQNLTDFECMTGNCTFAGNYTALGFCSSCEDVSTKVTITKSCSMISGPDKDPKKYPWPCDGRVMSAHSKGHMEIVPPAVWNITTAYPPFNMTFYHNWLNSTIFEIWADADIPYEDDTPDVFKIQESRCNVKDSSGGENESMSDQAVVGYNIGIIYGLSEYSIYHLPTGGRGVSKLITQYN